MADPRCALIVPYRDDGDLWRARVWDWLAWRYAVHHPAWPVHTGAPRSQPWRKGEAVLEALSRTDAELVVMADADSFVSPQALEVCVRAVIDGAPWAQPHTNVWRLGPNTTHALISGEPVEAPDVWQRGRQQRSVPVGGGVVVGWSADLRDVPPDPRFEGWGGEDIAWGWALGTMLGPHWTCHADLFHLWHQPSPNRRRAYHATEVLAGRYAEANGDRVRMAALIQEGRGA